MKTALFLLFFIITSAINPGFGQQKVTLRGVVLGADSAALTDAAVNLLRVTDSSVYAGTFTGPGGRFVFNRQDTGRFILYITAAGYRAFYSIFTATNHNRTDSFYLKPQPKTEEGVTVTGITPPVTIKTDTVEFNTAAWKARPNDAVEELLKKMPGFKLEPDGSLSYNGEKITRVLVDGKPFQLEGAATLKTLPIHIIEKIQVIDEKPKDQKYSKTDDGNREKVLNLTVKKDKKKGWFGNVSASAATNRQRDEKLSVTRFRDKRKFHFSGGDGQNVQVQGGQDNRSNSLNGQFSYNDAWNEEMDVSLRGSSNKNRGNYTRSSLRQTFLQNDTVLIGRNRSASSSSGHQESGNFNYNWEPSENQELSVDGGFNINHSQGQGAGSTQNSNQYGMPVNYSASKSSYLNRSASVNGSISYNHLLDTNGRSFSARVSLNTGSNENNGYNQADNIFYNPDSTVKRRDGLHQYRQSEGGSQGLQASASYNIPFFSHFNLQTSYSFNFGHSRSERYTYDYDTASGKFSLLNGLQTNGFSNRSFTHKEIVSLGYYKSRVSLTLRTGLQQVRHVNQNLDSLAPLTQSFFNILPGATVSFNKKNKYNIRLNYNGNTSQPSIMQRQPVVDNSNPLFIRSGNPGLKPEYSNQLNMNYSNGNRAKGRNIFISADFSNILNRITDVIQFDSEGKQFSRPENINGNYRGAVSVRLGYPISLKNKSHGGLNFSASNSRSISFINGLRNTGMSTGFNAGASASQHFGEWLFLNGSIGYQYSEARYSANQRNNRFFNSASCQLDADLQLPGNWRLQTHVDYQNRGSQVDFGRETTLWNLNVTKLLLNKKLRLTVSVNDLLAQNTGYSRTVGGNYIEESDNSVPGRFFRFTASYSLDKFARPPKSPKGGL